MAVKVCSICKEQFDEAAVICKYCGQPSLQTAQADIGSQTSAGNPSGVKAVSIGISLIVIAILILYLVLQL